MTRRSPRSRRVARFLIGVLLLAHVAVSAYACALISPVDVKSMTTMEDGAGCPDMEMGQDITAVCHRHCHQGDESTAHAPAPHVAAMSLGAFYVVTPVTQLMMPVLAPRVARIYPTAASPPHSLLHCCLRV